MEKLISQIKRDMEVNEKREEMDWDVRNWNNICKEKKEYKIYIKILRGRFAQIDTK